MYKIQYCHFANYCITHKREKAYAFMEFIGRVRLQEFKWFAYNKFRLFTIILKQLPKKKNNL